MGNKINDLKGRILFKGAKLCLKNAQDHFSSAELLANNEKYGLAISHLILSSEEAAKSIILYFKYNLPNYKGEIPDEIKDYNYSKHFRDHKPKQILAFFASFFGLLISKGLPFPVAILDMLKKSKDDYTEEEISEMVAKKEKKYNKSIDWLNKQIYDKNNSELSINSTWWKTVNKRKNDGFYVDYQNGDWQSPNIFRKKDYLEAKKMISGINEFIEVMLEVQEELDSYSN